ncbi:hypothetical protein DFJ74DRAFT_768629 [Hyaloraphidium curvatum]|nr:hypothetical protein DFJ74DRAFT_768629 [Hyaloraphidium curvatum]
MTSGSDALPMATRIYGRAPKDFEPAEWAALFPWPTKAREGGMPPEGDDRVSDPAADFRTSHALNWESFSRALSPWPSLRRLSQLQRSRGMRTVVEPRAVVATKLFLVVGSGCALLALTATASNGRFRTPQVVAFGTTFYLTFLTPPLRALMRCGHRTTAWNFGGDQLTGFVRWSQLAGLGSRDPENKEDSEKPSVLVEHWPDDPECPCSECLGNLGSEIALQLSLAIAAHGAMSGWAAWITTFWTPIVTVAPEALAGAWVVPWTILMLHIVFFWMPLSALANMMRCPAGLRPTLRLLHRAVAANLFSVLDCCREPLPQDDEYEAHVRLLVKLRRQLVAAATVRLAAGDRHTREWGIMLAVYFFSIVTVAAVGSCITVGTIVGVAAVLGIFLYDAYLSAYANRLASSVGNLYESAQVRLREWEAREGGQDPDPRRAERIRLVDRLLRAYRDVGSLQATLVGFPITFQVLRTFFVTMVTVAIGLWSLLRSAGLFFTIESICPSY